MHGNPITSLPAARVPPTCDVQMREWVADTGAQPCDSIAFKREGSELLVRRVPATQQPKGRWVAEWWVHVSSMTSAGATMPAPSCSGLACRAGPCAAVPPSHSAVDACGGFLSSEASRRPTACELQTERQPQAGWPSGLG